MKPTINATTSPTIKIASILALVTILAGCSATTTIDEYRPTADAIDLKRQGGITQITVLFQGVVSRAGWVASHQRIKLGYVHPDQVGGVVDLRLQIVLAVIVGGDDKTEHVDVIKLIFLFGVVQSLGHVETRACIAQATASA